ncbi:hypothetical protein D3C84_1213390 [compost metagenome]
MFSKVCRAKKVLVKPASSVMGWFFASAHQLVNAKLLEVFWRECLPFCSVRWPARTVLL